MSFQVSAERALENAGKLIKEGAFESVKLEGGEEVAEHVRRIVAAGIPVMGHVGLTPQSVHAMGGFKVQGKGDEAAERVLDGARALEEAGAYAIVLEAIPPDLAAEITAAVSVPTIGIGAGPRVRRPGPRLLRPARHVPGSPAQVRQALRRGGRADRGGDAGLRGRGAGVAPSPRPSTRSSPTARACAGLAPAASEPALSTDEIPPHWQTH